MSMAAVISLSIIVIGLTYIFATRNPERATRAYNRAEMIRNVVGGVFLVATVYTFFRSGNLALMAAGVIGLIFVTLYVVIEEPHKEVP